MEAVQEMPGPRRQVCVLRQDEKSLKIMVGMQGRVFPVFTGAFSRTFHQKQNNRGYGPLETICY